MTAPVVPPAAAERPAPPAQLGSRLALTLAVAAGVLIAVQARINGSLAEQSGSAAATALVSFAVGTVAIAVLVGAARRARRALRALPAGPLRWWYFIGGFGGAFLVAISAVAVPEIGVAMLGVCVVAGSTAGALAVDRVGLGPGGRRPITAPRLTGAGIAVVALAVSALGRTGGDAGAGLYLAVVAAGAAVAVQQAVNGRLQQVSGDATVAALVSFLVGTTALAVLVLVLASTGALPALTWPGDPWLYVGGLGGAAFIIICAATVSTLGVLRLGLATIAGQMSAGVLLDAVAPADAAGLRVATVVGALLTVAAVSVAGRPTWRSR